MYANICTYTWVYLTSELKCIILEKKALGRAKNSFVIFLPNYMTGLYCRMKHLERLEIWQLLKNRIVSFFLGCHCNGLDGLLRPFVILNFYEFCLS